MKIFLWLFVILVVIQALFPIVSGGSDSDSDDYSEDSQATCPYFRDREEIEERTKNMKLNEGKKSGSSSRKSSSNGESDDNDDMQKLMQARNGNKNPFGGPGQSMPKKKGSSKSKPSTSFGGDSDDDNSASRPKKFPMKPNKPGRLGPSASDKSLGASSKKKAARGGGGDSSSSSSNGGGSDESDSDADGPKPQKSMPKKSVPQKSMPPKKSMQRSKSAMPTMPSASGGKNDDDNNGGDTTCSIDKKLPKPKLKKSPSFLQRINPLAPGIPKPLTAHESTHDCDGCKLKRKNFVGDKRRYEEYWGVDLPEEPELPK